MNISSLVTPTQPSLKGSKIPNGHIQLNSKYHDSEISKKITGMTFFWQHISADSPREEFKRFEMYLGEEPCYGSTYEKHK